MPQFEMLEEAPSFGEQLSQQLGAGVGQGLQKSLESFHANKRQEQLGKVFEQIGLPKSFSSLETPVLKEVLKLQQNQQLMSQLFPQQEEFVEDKIEDTGKDFSDEQILAVGLQNPALGRILQSQQKMKQQENLANRKETTGLRTDFAKKGSEAKKSIDNKKQMLALIEKGNLNHPLVAGIANVLPLNAGQLLLSDDSQLYRSLMFENFGILKSMFPGQIRVKEIELLEDKLAGLEKNDEAKKKILENQMNAAKADIIRAKAAAEVEKKFPNVGVSQFEEKVEEIAAPQLEKLYDDIIKNYNEISQEYGAEVEVIDRKGNVVGTVKISEKDQLPPGYRIKK